ncbi:two-component system sensor histidine kinase YesM [Paenibacillus endophyticus]|uniref:histidine kinase n=1 Tax=Paenibacillus endophyticus TaxID=1294268 RepID=A0A7W5C3V8_9BACL|nr:sensor histidine kinase [Paenibacillus endophyticus]MBB3150695.1 two-component system sensor histidine kinase YesM [Paenibacillus endophyticus]
MRTGIRTKLFASFSVVIIASLSIVSVLWYNKYYDSQRESAESFMSRTILDANKSFELTLKDIDYISTIISLNKPNVIDMLLPDATETLIERLEKDRKIDNFISSLYGYKYYISSILVASIGGRSYAQGSTVPADEFMRSIWYEQLLKQRGNKIFITTHANTKLNKVSAYLNQNVVSISRAIMNGSEAVGYVNVDFNYEVVERIFNTPLPNKSQLFLLDDKGGFVYSPRAEDINKPIAGTDYASVLPLLTASSGKLSMRINGEEHLVVYHTSDYTNWTTVGLIPLSELLAESRKAANNIMLIPVLTLIAALIVATIISNQITKNIGRLRHAMKKVSAGNLSDPITISSGDEVEELSRGFNAMVTNLRVLLDDVKKTEEQKRVLEFKALQAQINPHFLFNTLNQIKWLADVQKADNIKQLVTSLVTLLHSSMGKGGEFISVREEQQYLEHYLNIQQFRYYDKFDAVFDIEEGILEARMLKFLLQPIVENALIHGLEPLKGRGQLMVKGYGDEGHIVLQVSDNGVGIEPERLATIFDQVAEKNQSRFSGIGLGNVQERIRLHYGAGYGLQIESVPGLFTTVTMRIPIEAEGENEDA